MRILTLFMLLASMTCAFPQDAASDAIVPEKHLPKEMMFAEEISLLEDDDSLNVLKNIVQLKAYCISAFPEAKYLGKVHSKIAAIVSFVESFGDPAHTDENPVTQYSQVLGSLKAKFGSGVNAYVLDHLDKAIRHDPEGVVNLHMDQTIMGGMPAAYLRFETLGLQDVPSVIGKLAAKLNHYQDHYQVLFKQSQNADVVAAMLFLQNKGMGHYKSFLAHEVAKVQKRMREEHNFVAKAAFDGAQEAFEKAYKQEREAYFAMVSAQAPAAVDAANQAAAEFGWTPPSMEELKAKADKASKEFMAEFQQRHNDPSSMLRRITEEVGGVKLFIVTGTVTDATSTMKPSITIKGKHSELTKEIRAVPAVGCMMVQHLPAKEAIGDIESVVLTGTGAGLKWNVAGLKIRSGGVDAGIYRFTSGNPGTFWLESGKTVELFPEPKPETSSEEKIANPCSGFKATMQCDGKKGTRDKDSDKVCNEDIDSSMSGYCQCAAGAAKAVDCGHDTFTCEEICKIMD